MTMVKDREIAWRPPVLIGITNEDLYLRSVNWEYCFGIKLPELNAGIISTARMELHYPTEPAGEATPEARLRKYLARYIGMIYFRKGQSTNPKSALYWNVMSLGDLDQLSEDF